MVNKVANQASEGNKRNRGRPRTASEAKRRLDNAERQRKYRARQRLKNLAITKISEKPINTAWLDLLRHLNGQPTSTEKVTVQYCDTNDKSDEYRETLTWPEVESLLRDTTIINLNVDTNTYDEEV